MQTESVDTSDKCARCCASPNPRTGEEDGATSRAAMEGLPPVQVCVLCREREAFASAEGLPLIPFSRWPVPLSRLLAEDAARLRYRRERGVGELIRDRRRRARANLDR
jgi:hypothetical protein